MTPTEFAEAHGLSLEEAEFVISRRRALAEVEESGGRVGLARQALLAVQKRVGVHPVSVEEGGVKQTHDPDAEVGLRNFYGKLATPVDGPIRYRLYVMSEEEVSQDPKDW